MAEAAAPAAGETLDALFGGGQPTHPAFVVPDDGQVLSYAEMADRIETLAGRLAAAGVRRGDRVALTLPNSPDFVQLLLAVTLLGAAAAPLNPAYTEPEIHVLPGGRRPSAAADAGRHAPRPRRPPRPPPAPRCWASPTSPAARRTCCATGSR